MHQPKLGTISLAEFLEWEERQADRYEWDDGEITRCEGGSDDHAAIILNLAVLLDAALPDGPCFVRTGSERKLVPRDRHGNDLGSYYSDVFVSCAEEDRTGTVVHFPTLVIEVLSQSVGLEFTRKQQAYLASRDIKEYLIIDSTERFVHHRYWTSDGHIAKAEYTRGPFALRSLDLTLSFEQIYRKTNVKTMLRAVYPGDEILIEE